MASLLLQGCEPAHAIQSQNYAPVVYHIDAVNGVVYKLGARILDATSELLGPSRFIRHMAHLVIEV